MKHYFVLITFMIISIGYSQTKPHNTNCMHCRYSKNYIAPKNKPKDGNQGRASDICGCTACSEKKQKEKAARILEQKRIDDAIAAKNKAKHEAEQKRMNAERMALIEKNKATDVVINNTPIGPQIKPEPAKKAQSPNDKTIFARAKDRVDFSSGSVIPGAFFNEKDELIIENRDWDSAHDLLAVSLVKDVQKKYGVIRINGFYNLVNAKGEYLINDNSIVTLMHIRDHWFLISNRSFDYYLLNPITQKKIELPFFGNERKWSAYECFTAILSDKIVQNTSGFTIHMGSFEGLYRYKIKESILQYFPNEINEEVLDKYLFVLLQSGDRNMYGLHDPRAIEKVQRIEMYGITREGKMETIRLK